MYSPHATNAVSTVPSAFALHTDAAQPLLQRTHSQNPPISLDKMQAGQIATVLSVAENSPSLLRLAEMGITVGTKIQLTRRAPWGDPVEVSVRGTQVCLRERDAAQISVVLLA